MFDINTFKQLLDTAKSDHDLEQFIHIFYVKAIDYKVYFEEDEFNGLLTVLYNLSDGDYNKWYKAFNRVSYTFIRSNLDLISNIISHNDIESFKTAYEMYKKTLSYASRALPVKANYNDVLSKKDELIEQINELTHTIIYRLPNNPAKKAKEDFEELYINVKNNPLLSDYYDQLYNSLEKTILLRAEDELKRINSQSIKYSSANSIFHQKSIK